MSERLVAYVEPRLRRRVMWGGIAVAIGTCLLARLLGYGPDLIIAAFFVSLLGAFLLLHFLTQDERVSVQERMRLYQAVFPYWERVAARALIFGVPFGPFRAEPVETLRDLVFAVLFFSVAGLVFGLTQEWLSQWLQRRAERQPLLLR